MPERYLQPFRSVRFNIWLFTVIALASVVGTFLPEANIYHSAWFSTLLGLMAFDVVACKLRRLPALVHGAPRRPEEKSIDRIFSKSRLRASVASRLSPEEASRAVRAWFEEIGLEYQEESLRASDGAASGFFGVRHGVQRWGDMVLHVSIVAILAGGLMGTLFGFDEILAIPVGSTVRMKHRPLDVALEDFDMQYYAATGEVSRYASVVSVSKDGAPLKRKQIVVNDPLDIDRVRFYQASWGMTDLFKSAVLRIGGKDHEIRPGQVIDLGGTGLAVRANRVAPTFEVGEGGRPRVVDRHGRNPALQLDFIEKGQVRVAIWLMYNRPEAYRIEGDRVVPAPPPPFLWVALDPILFSGIQVGYDPGAPLFWVGAMFLMAGLCSHFYLHQRRISAVVVGKGGGSEVMIGGWNSRTPPEFEAEFEAWIGRLRREVA